jgi:hypothetical protein
MMMRLARALQLAESSRKKQARGMHPQLAFACLPQCSCRAMHSKPLLTRMQRGFLPSPAKMAALLATPNATVPPLLGRTVSLLHMQMPLATSWPAPQCHCHMETLLLMQAHSLHCRHQPCLKVTSRSRPLWLCRLPRRQHCLKVTSKPHRLWRCRLRHCQHCLKVKSSQQRVWQRFRHYPLRSLPRCMDRRSTCHGRFGRFLRSEQLLRHFLLWCATTSCFGCTLLCHTRRYPERAEDSVHGQVASKASQALTHYSCCCVCLPEFLLKIGRFGDLRSVKHGEATLLFWRHLARGGLSALRN